METERGETDRQRQRLTRDRMETERGETDRQRQRDRD